MSYNPHHISNTYLPVVDDSKLRRIILHLGRNLTVWKKSEATKCNKCWDNLSGTFDPECTNCAGGYNFEKILIKGILLQKDSHALYNVDNLRTVAGNNERADFDIYVQTGTGYDISLDDIIVIDQDFRDDIEVIVNSKRAFHGSIGKNAGWRIIVFKTPIKTAVAESSGKTL